MIIRIKKEENNLIIKFGDEYQEYMEKNRNVNTQNNLNLVIGLIIKYRVHAKIESG